MVLLWLRWDLWIKLGHWPIGSVFNSIKYRYNALAQTTIILSMNQDSHCQSKDSARTRSLPESFPWWLEGACLWLLSFLLLQTLNFSNSDYHGCIAKAKARISWKIIQCPSHQWFEICKALAVCPKTGMSHTLKSTWVWCWLTGARWE